MIEDRRDPSKYERSYLEGASRNIPANYRGYANSIEESNASGVLGYELLQPT